MARQADPRRFEPYAFSRGAKKWFSAPSRHKSASGVRTHLASARRLAKEPRIFSSVRCKWRSGRFSTAMLRIARGRGAEGAPFFARSVAGRRRSEGSCCLEQVG